MAMTVAFANVTQVHLGHFQYSSSFSTLSEWFKADSTKVKLIIQRRLSITKDMVEVEGHLQVCCATVHDYTFTLVTDILATTVLAFLLDIDSKVNTLAIFLSCPDNNQTVTGSRA